MAKEDNKRFQLEKSKDREFDISKRGKRNFDLTKDSDEISAVSTLAVSDSQNPKDSLEKSKHWIWIIGVLVALAILAWWLLSKPSKQSAPMLEEQKPAVEDVVITTEERAETSEPSSASHAEVQNPEIPSSEPQTPSQVPSVSSTNQGQMNVSDDIEAEALKVIRGVYGDGDSRKKSLGSRYNLIQSRVNQLKKEGAF